MPTRRLLPLLLLFSALVAQAEPKALTDAERAAGWRLLFDGRTLQGWRAFAKPGTTAAIGPGWKVEHGLLKKLAGQKGGDLVTVDSFDNFELSWEWRLEPGANNGIKYLVTEARPQAPGLEYQMIDDESPRWRDLPPKDLTASFYQVLPPAAGKPYRRAGEWNSSRLVVAGNHVEHWLNGVQVLTYELGSAALKTAIAASKFKNQADFGQKIRGHIMLTDHQDEAWFRNIKLRELPAR